MPSIVSAADIYNIMYSFPVSEQFLAAMLIIFLLPYAVCRLGRTDYFAPLVVVQIIFGILLGPGVLGSVFPQIYSGIFSPDVIKMLNGIATWGVMLLVWIAGIELELEEAWVARRETFVTATLALFFPFLLGCIAALLLLEIDQDAWIGANGTSWQLIMGIGMACAVTAVPILVLFLEKLNILRVELGQRILRFASLDDIIIWGVLALILLDWERVGRQVGFFIIFLPAAWLLRRYILRVSAQDRWFFSLIWLALCGLVADWAGLHYMVGAFLSGVVMEARWYNQKHLDLFRHHILIALLPVFFLSTGLKTHWGAGGITVFAAAFLLLVAAVGGKLLGISLAGRILKWRKGEAAIIAWLLQTKALIMIIFTGILLDKDVITNTTFTALLLMAVGFTMLTIPVVSSRLKKIKVSGSNDV